MPVVACKDLERIAAQDQRRDQKASLGVSSLLKESEAFHERAIGILSKKVKRNRSQERNHPRVTPIETPR